MIPKRQLILTVILVVALNLTFSAAYAASCSHVETWNFNFNTYVKGWNNVETWSFMVNEIYLWNHIDETTAIISCRGWLSILGPALIIVFAAILIAIIYTKRKTKQ